MQILSKLVEDVAKLLVISVVFLGLQENVLNLLALEKVACVAKPSIQLLQLFLPRLFLSFKRFLIQFQEIKVSYELVVFVFN